MEAIDEVFSAIGPDSSRVILYHMQERRGIEPNEIHNMPEEFHSMMQEMFSNFSPILEESICRSIMRKNPMHESKFLEFFLGKRLEVTTKNV